MIANAVRDIRKPDHGDILLEWAHRIGPNVRAWAERCFASRDFPELALATVQDMIDIAEGHDGAHTDALRAGGPRPQSPRLRLPRGTPQARR